MRALLLLLLAALLAPLAPASDAEAETRYAQGVQAYREGDAATAANVLPATSSSFGARSCSPSRPSS